MEDPFTAPDIFDGSEFADDDCIPLRAREAICPECGEPLEVSVYLNRKTKRLFIGLYCEGDMDDFFDYEISTGLTNHKLAKLSSDRKNVTAMEGRLLQRGKGLLEERKELISFWSP